MKEVEGKGGGPGPSASKRARIDETEQVKSLFGTAATAVDIL